MNVCCSYFGLYNLDEQYVHQLRTVDPTVIYPHRNRPYLGIFTLDDYDYFIPLSSPKQKNTPVEEEGKHHFLLYEYIRREDLRAKNVIREDYGDELQKLLATLNVSNMIPVPQSKVIMDYEYKDIKYIDLLMKEYRACERIKSSINDKVLEVRTSFKPKSFILQEKIYHENI